MKTLLLLSGGLDSSILLYYLMEDAGQEVTAISFNYGQRHSKEISCARWFAEDVGISHIIVDLPRLGGSALTEPAVITNVHQSEKIPHGHYEDACMKATIVPGRNMIMLGYAANIAIANKMDAIAIANHAGDHAIYPDCREDFIRSMRSVLSPLEVLSPFCTFSKKEIVNIGWELEVPFGMTWTCYEGGKRPCGKCGACVEREEALPSCSW